MKRRIGAFLAAGALLVTVAGCSGTPAASESPSESAAESVTANAEATETDEAVAMPADTVYMDDASWEELSPAAYIPKPPGTLEDGELGYDGADAIYFAMTGTNGTQFHAYVQEVQDAGFNVDVGYDGDGSFRGFDADGRELTLGWYVNRDETDNDTISIGITQPLSFEEISWPTIGPGSLLPAPTAVTTGTEMSDTSDKFQVILGPATKEDWNTLVKEYAAAGFTEDYKRDESPYRGAYYEAKNAEGYELYISYYGGGQIRIQVDAPEETES